MRIPFACSVAVWAVAFAADPAPAAAQDPALVDALAQVLAVEDARRYDAPVLTVAARHPDPRVRRRAALALGRIGSSEGLPQLTQLLTDAEAVVRRDAALALGLLGDTTALGALREIALGEAPAVGFSGGEAILEAVTAIARIGGPGAVAIYRELLGRHVGRAATADLPVTVERAVAEAWRFGADAPVDLLIEYTVSPLRQLRLGAVYSLARLRAPRASDVLLAATDNAEAEVRMHAVRALTAAFADSAALDRRALATRVRGLVGDEDPRVRTNALRTLATYRDSSLVPTVADRLTDRDLNVRVQAAATLGDLGGAEAARALRAQVDRQPFALRRQALIGLARVEGTAALDVAGRWITDADWTARLAGSEALGYIVADTVVPWLVHMTRDPDARVAAVALVSLVAIAPDAASRRARELVTHADPAVRAVALDRLAAAPDTADLDLFVAAYEAAGRDPILDARLAALAGLARLAEADFGARVAVETRFLSRVPRPDDYLIRRAAEEQFPLAAERWGAVRPIATGRAIDDYRDIVRRILLPAEAAGGGPTLVVEASQGRFVLTLFGADAPLTVNALLELVDRRYFDNGRWHRVVPNFVIQDGDPRGDGWGGPGFALRDEVNHRRYGTGTVGMALSGPDTGGSQFFITHSPQPHLDGTYTVIGRVESGMDIVQLVTQGDRIRRIRRP